MGEPWAIVADTPGASSKLNFGFDDEIETIAPTWELHVLWPSRSLPPEESPSKLPSALHLEIVDTIARARSATIEPSSKWKDKLSGVLISYSQLPPDWDGFGGQPASNEALTDALDFLTALPNEAPPPKAMLAGSGEIGLYWEGNEVYAELGFIGDGCCSYYVELPSGRYEEKESVVLDGTHLPQILNDALQEMIDA